MTRILFFLFVLIPLLSVSQTNVPCEITLKTGQTLLVHHFGYLKCGEVIDKNVYNNVVKIHGFIEVGHNYFEEITHSDYSQIKRIELKGFYRKPKYGYGMKKRYEKATIMVYQKNKLPQKLLFAYLGHTCSGTYSDGVNELRLQVKNPETQKIEELKFATKDIESIEFN
ncbi:hypothetical protein [Yeosuana sp. AK3]